MGSLKPRNLHRHNWEAIFLEWITSADTLHNFFKTKTNIHPQAGWAYAKKHDWKAKAKKIKSNAMRRAITKLEKEKALDFARHIKANDDLLSFVNTELKKGNEKDENGDIVGLTPDTIAKLSTAVEKIVKTHSFMKGGPTDRTESKSLNVHSDIVDLIEKQKKGEL